MALTGNEKKLVRYGAIIVAVVVAVTMTLTMAAGSGSGDSSSSAGTTDSSASAAAPVTWVPGPWGGQQTLNDTVGGLLPVTDAGPFVVGEDGTRTGFAQSRLGACAFTITETLTYSNAPSWARDILAEQYYLPGFEFQLTSAEMNNTGMWRSFAPGEQQARLLGCTTEEPVGSDGTVATECRDEATQVCAYETFVYLQMKPGQTARMRSLIAWHQDSNSWRKLEPLSSTEVTGSLETVTTVPTSYDLEGPVA